MDDEESEESEGFQFVFAPYCSHGYPTMDLIETPDPKRPGWMRGECRLCRRLVGFRNTVNSDKRKASYE